MGGFLEFWGFLIQVLRYALLSDFSFTFAAVLAGFNDLGEAENIFLSGWYMDGEKVTQLSANNPMVCLESCEVNPLCEFGLFYPQNRTCDLKRNAASIVRSMGSILVASTYKTFSRVQGASVLDASLPSWGNLLNEEIFVGNEEICRKLCAVFPQCNTAVFRHPVQDVESTDSNKCILRKVMESPSVYVTSVATSYIA